MTALILASALGLASGSARAQSDVDMAIRRQLIDDAVRAAQAGEHERALDLAQRAARIRMTPSLRSFVAARFMALQRFVEASSAAEQCVAELRRDAAAPDRERLIADCSAVTTQASTRVGRVLLEGVDASIAGLTVSIGGSVMNNAFIGVAVIANPGSVAVEVSAPGYEAVRRVVEVQAQQTTRVTVTLARVAVASPTPSRAAEPPPVAREPSAPSVAIAPQSPPSVVIAPRSSPPSRAAPVAAIVIGGVAVGAGLALFGARVALFAGCEQTAAGNVCRDDVAEANGRTAVDVNDAAIVATSVGAAVLAGGVAWYLLSAPAPQSAANRARFHVAPMLAGPAGLVLGGSF